jgi:N-acyl-D-aspartate/D-glutamate deacylase
MWDTLIRGGVVFDGSQDEGRRADVAIRNGCVVAISNEPLAKSGARRVIDADGAWVMPGFIDIHTHYDAELLLAPELTESLRHGVTTILTGSCSLSTVHSSALDCSDMFSRVEALPREHLLPALERHKNWDDARGWIERLESSALGPNVASFLGHSDLRSHVMGFEESLGGSKSPSKEQRVRMQHLLNEALDAGFVGMSTMTNPWDKIDGDRCRSRPLPSTFARWSEYRSLHKILRKRQRVLQSAPNLNTKVNMFLFFLSSAALPWRKALRTSLISAADVRADEWLVGLLPTMTGWLNRLLRADLKWQTLPMPFEVYADGMDLVVFEEFGAGAAALHIADALKRKEFINSESYRRRFRMDYEKKFSPRIWHRDLYEARIVACPESAVVGKSFGEVADERGIHPTDAFLDLVVAHGKSLRWKTLIANHRPEKLARLVARPEVQIGFSDSGAHLRNMGFYNFPLHMLRMAKQAQQQGRAWMSPGRSVKRLTSELADWYGLDAGRITCGGRADIAVVNPAALDARLDAVHEADMPGMPGLRRMVRRNDDAVLATLVGGRVAWQDGKPGDCLGRERLGRFLRAGVEQRDALPDQQLQGSNRSQALRSAS